MNTVKIKKVSLLLAVILSVQIFFAANSSAAYVDNKYISSAGACVMDYATGDVLYQYNGYSNRSPASMTKLLSLYCIFEALKKNNISYDTVVPISEKAYSMPVKTDLQCIPLYYNSKYTVHQLVSAVVTHSAANALMALVEFVAGSENEFVKIMNSTSQKMGLNAQFYDCTGGLTNSISPVNMAHLARNIIRDYPQIIDYANKSSIIFNGERYNSTNKLLTSLYYAGADGLKTGTSSSAGSCFCGTAVRNGERVITVTMGSAGGNARFTDTISLMDYGFKKISEVYTQKLCYAHTRVYMNGYQIPVLEYVSGDFAKPVIFVEDLANYGFDVVYNSEYSIYKVTLNPQKEILPLNCDKFKGKYGTRVAGASNGGNIKVVVNDGTKDVVLDRVYTSGGKPVVFAEDFGYVFRLFWNGEASIIDVIYSTDFPRGTHPLFKPRILVKQNNTQN